MIDLKELLLYTKELKVLFAEDHEELRRNTTDILENFFKEVISVNDGKKALEVYTNDPQSFHIVLSDIQMPYLNGVELTQEIYKLNPTQPIIILSAHDESEYLLPLINLGIAQFIKKPIDYNKLVEILFDVSKKISQNSVEKETIQTQEIYIDKKTIYSRENKTLISNNETIYITKFEILLLDLLTDESKKIYSNEAIVDYFKSFDEFIDPQNIRKLISKLRKKLPKDTLNSVYGVGYRLITL